MQPNLRDTIAALDERQTIICCRGLVILMDRYMACHPRSRRPRDVTVTDFHQWIRMGGRPVKALAKSLREEKPAITAAVGRRLMGTCLLWGCQDAVRSACRLIYAPVNALGKLAPETVVAALAAIMLWHPTGPTLNALLQPEPMRRSPWRRIPEPTGQRSDNAPTETRRHEKAVSPAGMTE
jgi:hypothetical protein